MFKHLFTLAFLGCALTAQAKESKDSYQHIRNATAKINYAGQTFLIDPMLAPKDAYEGFKMTFNSEKRYPMIELPMSVDEVLKDVVAIILTHTHADHYDPKAKEVLPKNLPIIVQNSSDAKIVREDGLKDVRILFETLDFNGVTLTKTGGAHGTPEMYAIPDLAKVAGDAMGVVFSAKGRPTLYIVGDTVWTADVNKALSYYAPDILVMNTGYAQLTAFPNDSIIMGTADVAHAYKAQPKAKIITVHMDAVNHATTTSKDMREFVEKNKMQDRVSIPKEGESIDL